MFPHASSRHSSRRDSRIQIPRDFLRSVHVVRGKKSLPAILALLLLTACSETEPGGKTHDPGLSSPILGEDSSHGSDEHHDEHHDEHRDGPTIVELSKTAAAQIELRLQPVESRVLAAETSTTGQVGFDPTRVAHVSPRISGRVHRVDVQLGQTVTAGQRLVEIDSIELGQAKAAYLQAKAKEELARTSFERVESLVAEGIASQQKVLEAEIELKEASAALYTAEESLYLYGLDEENVRALSYGRREAPIYGLRAPFSGTVVEHHVTLGELVTPERNLFTIADLDRVWIWIDVAQRDLERVHVGDRAQTRVDAFPDQVFEGEISYLSAQVDPDTRTVRARVDAENVDGKLRPGMFVEVDLFDPHQRDDEPGSESSLVVPTGSVIRDDGKSFVFVAIDELRFERREVRVGRSAGGFVVITNVRGADVDGVDGPLAPGDQVVVEGAFLLKSAASKESLGGGHDH